ncbi:hypothetical protein [Shewanella seohaensis]|uniref:Uncharacterized protein n=1 Tax=Shewanella seohaensis TaxID=755175 RepID=A0ABV4VXE5_9GAMM
MTKRQENTPSFWLLSGGLVVIHIIQWIAEGIAAQFSDLPVVFGLSPSELILLASIVLQLLYTLFVVTIIAVDACKQNK